MLSEWIFLLSRSCLIDFLKKFFLWLGSISQNDPQWVRSEFWGSTIVSKSGIADIVCVQAKNI